MSELGEIWDYLNHLEKHTVFSLVPSFLRMRTVIPSSPKPSRSSSSLLYCCPSVLQDYRASVYTVVSQKGLGQP